ncbi:hypothetical protein F1721_25375 [Saccharopolyspora hirsuta]|uniref:Uncharacterized protein n=1 Tax=Saccharopolyspora hirsuta TaxID=1837 RepID=A0A5M7BIX3_SACHI|nr:hypothetical protein F1721_25375 [Saccharopolyspora hirsuta]
MAGTFARVRRAWTTVILLAAVVRPATGPPASTHALLFGAELVRGDTALVTAFVETLVPGRRRQRITS